MLVFDTNVLIYAVDEYSEFHLPCFNFLDESRNSPTPAFLTWGICYEFLRVSTHPRILKSPRSMREAWRFLENLLDASSFGVLGPTQRHGAVLSEILDELPDIRGSIAHDLHTAVLMREHGISRICSRDSDFLRFPFLSVIGPLRQDVT